MISPKKSQLFCQKNDKICRQKKSLPVTNYIWEVASNETMQLTDTWLWTPKKWFIKPLSCSTNNSKVVRTVLNCPDLLIDSQLHAMKRMKPTSPPPFVSNPDSSSCWDGLVYYYYTTLETVERVIHLLIYLKALPQLQVLIMNYFFLKGFVFWVVIF